MAQQQKAQNVRVELAGEQRLHLQVIVSRGEQLDRDAEVDRELQPGESEGVGQQDGQLPQTLIGKGEVGLTKRGLPSGVEQ